MLLRVVSLFSSTPISPERSIGLSGGVRDSNQSNSTVNALRSTVYAFNLRGCFPVEMTLLNMNLIVNH